MPHPLFNRPASARSARSINPRRHACQNQGERASKNLFVFFLYLHVSFFLQPLDEMGGAGVAGSSSGPSVHEFIDISQDLGYRAAEMGGNLLADFNRYIQGASEGDSRRSAPGAPKRAAGCAGRGSFCPWPPRAGRPARPWRTESRRIVRRVDDNPVAEGTCFIIWRRARSL